MNDLDIIGRNEELFSVDIAANNDKLATLVSSSRFLVIGGSGDRKSVV